MLNLFKLNFNSKSGIKINDTQVKSCKQYPSSVREWNNSLYVFNKNCLDLSPEAAKLSLKLIKSYFNLYNKKLERKIREKRLLSRLKRVSSNKIYVSNGEFKHTNNKVIITLYLFNKQKQNFSKVDNKYLRAFTDNLSIIKNWFKLIKYKNFVVKMNLLKKLKLDTINDNNENSNILLRQINIFYNKLLIKTLKQFKLFLYHKQIMHINSSKLNYTYLYSLKKYLVKIYNKNVEFNLVNLKRFYLNSDILSESILLKIKRNRRKLLKNLNSLRRKVKIHKTMNYYEPVYNEINSVNVFTKKSLEKFVLESLKHKHVKGFRLEAKGRLTKRYTASKSITKLRYKGNLLNIDSSYKGLSSVLLKGNLRSNLQYTKLNSKTRIGSFGIKGWISSN